MNNLFAEVYVPALQTTLDVLIPVHITVRQGIQLIAEIIDKKEHFMLNLASLLLYDADNKVVLNESDTFEAAPVQDACRLVLI